jgi:hypothetical protein
MRLKLGSVNLALLSIYFVPAWGRDAVRALTSPYHGLEDRVHAAAATYFRQLFELGLDGLVLTSHVLAGIKLVIAAGFVAYAIEFARSLVIKRDVDKETQEVVIIFALIGTVIWALPALALGDAGLIRLYATQLLMVAGAVVTIIVERQIEKAPRYSRTTTVTLEQRGERVPLGALIIGPPPRETADALARIPEIRLRRR